MKQRLIKEKDLRTKPCKMCEQDYTDHYRTYYCDKCKKLRVKQDSKNQSKRVSEKVRKKLDDNFLNNNFEGLDLLPTRFNKISKIKYQNYNNHFRIPWLDILKHYGKYNSLKYALRDEYVSFYNNTGNFGFELFGKYLKLSNNFIPESIQHEFRDFIGVEYNRKTDEQLENNFKNICLKLGRIPFSIEEFRGHSSISVSTYTNKYNIKGDLMLNIVKLYITEESNLDKYIKDKELRDKQLREDLNKIISKKLSRSKEDIIEVCSKAIEKFLSKNDNKLPKTEEFKRITRTDLRIIKEKFGMGYYEFLKFLGYDTFNYEFVESEKTEHRVLNNIGTILQSHYLPQHWFEWLKGTKGWVLKCDAYFEDLNLVVEYDGEQHFYPIDFAGKGEEWAINQFEEVKKNDQIKNNLIPQHNLKLFRIAYDEPYSDIDYLKFKLLSIGMDIPNYTIISEK